MGRRPKITLVEPVEEVIEHDPLPIPEEPEMPKIVFPKEVTLGNRKFMISPIAQRGTDTSFDEAGDFAIEAIPLVQRMFGMVMTGNLDVGLEDDKINISDGQAVVQLLSSANELEFQALMRDMRTRLPKMVSIALEISVEEVKKLSGTPLNTQLLEIAFTQIAADGILESVLGLTAGFGLGGKAVTAAG